MQARPPAGWYPDPSGRRGLRWWDGAQWGPQAPLPAAGTVTAAPPLPGTAPWGSQVPPAAPGASTAVPAAGVGPTRSPLPWAWGVAAMPAIQLIVGVLVGLAGGAPVGRTWAIAGGAVAATLLGVFMAVRDARALRAAGEQFSSGLAAWCLLSGWAYLLARAIKRASRTNSDWMLFAVSVVTWLVVIVIATPVINSAITSGSVFNRTKVQSDVAQAIYNRTGTRVTVNCPQDPPLSPGSQFQCVATADDGSTAMATITIADTSGDYTWQVTG